MDLGSNDKDTPGNGTKLSNRNICKVVEFEEAYRKDPEPPIPIVQRLKNACIKCCTKKELIKSLHSNFPFIRVLKKYKVKDDLANDIIAGMTVGIMQIPQGMAYALLSTLPPIVGLYISFFSPLAYFFLGTSRHASMGCIAVVSLMVGSVIDSRFGKIEGTAASQQTTSLDGFNITTTQPYANTSMSTLLPDVGGALSSMDTETLQKIELASAVSLVSGITMMCLGKLNMGLMATYMSEPMVSGFTSGVAIHVLTSQTKHILGVKIQRHNGILKVVKTWIDVFKNITTVNFAPVITSVLCMIVLYLVKIHINQRFKSKLKIPIPIEIIVVAIATLISHYGMFKTQFSVDVLEDIPSGIPQPSVPDVTLVGESLKDAFIIGVVAFTQSVSMSKILARKNNYHIEPNQEMIAYGASSVACSLFSGYIPAASVARTMVQDGAGGHTQVASLFGCIVVLVVILAVGPLFYSLPKCVLSSVILVNLRGMFLQLLELKPLWRKSKYDFIIWIVTFCSTVILDADIGIAIGIIFSLLTVAIRTQRPEYYSATYVGEGQILKSSKHYNSAKDINHVKIVSFQSPVYFANGDMFLKAVRKTSGIDTEVIRKRRKKSGLQTIIVKKKTNEETDAKDDTKEASKTEPDKLLNDTDHLNDLDTKLIVLDFRGVSFVDVVGVKTIKRVFNEYNDIGVDIRIAGCCDGVIDIFRTTELLDDKGDFIFVDIDSATSFKL